METATAQPDALAASTQTAPTLAEPATTLDPVERWNRKIDTAIVVLLAAASLMAAWGGYQASLWSGKKTSFITTAEQQQIDAGSTLSRPTSRPSPRSTRSASAPNCVAHLTRG
jgi:hypothetical protein